jgi:acetyl esterase/lipase
LPRIRLLIYVTLLALVLALGGCAPSAESNVVGYLIARRLGNLTPPSPAAPGSLVGMVQFDGAPVSGATVVVAERLGVPHAAVTNPDGRYRIDGIPPGQYVPAAVGPDYEETTPTDFLGIPRLVTIHSGEVSEAPLITLERHIAAPLPEPLLPAVQLTISNTYTATTNFPPGSIAQVQTFRFTDDGATVDTLRLYLPLDLTPEQKLPMLFMVYPANIDGWEPISVAYAAQGYAVVAIAPIGARGMNIEAHAQDMRIAFALARSGALGPHISPSPAVALGGSFSSPILHRFLRDERAEVAAWVTVGGISNAFSGAADFYAGSIELPERYRLAIPALGFPNLYPLPFLRYSPIYTAAHLPPTMIIHTDADRITPMDQAVGLEHALRAAGVPVEVFYYADVSHYLQIGDDMTEAGVEMFFRILDFVEKYQPS